MKKTYRGIGIFIVAMVVASFGASARQADLGQLSRSLAAKSDAERAAAYALAAKNGWPIRGTGGDGSYFELQKIVNGPPCCFATFNANAAITTRTDSVNMAIGGGSGLVLRLWDGGKPRTTHRELIGRITWADAIPAQVLGHTTHVAGTMIAAGIRAEARGMAYASTLRAFEWNNDGSEMAAEAAAGANLSNHSYGYLGGWYFYSGDNYYYWYGDTAVSEVEDYRFGFYDSETRMYDQILNAAPDYLPVVSAANDRDDFGPPPGTKHYYWDARYGMWRFSFKTRDPDGGAAGYDCIAYGFQISKNTLTVGGVQDVLSYTGPESVVLGDFSSTGPCDDGRIKPDVVGNGVEILSSYNTNDSSYAVASGTSMASPGVCGSLGLLADYYRDTHGDTPMRASTLKALAIHTALEAGPDPGPDYRFGWGLLNAYAAYRIVHEDYLDHSRGLVEQLTLDEGQTIEIDYRVSASTPELRATICWNDPAGTPPEPSLNPRTRMLVNDLDLRAIKGADTHYPWRLDVYNPAAAATRADNDVDNVEQVVVETPAPGVYTIRISHKGILSGGSQEVSLVVSGAARNHVWHVYEDGSGDAPTIAEAVAAADDGDSILVHQGTYGEAGISVSKALVIAGVDGAALTAVDGAGLGNGCFSVPATDKVIRIRELTVRNGSTAALGGGISCGNSLVTIERCIVESSHSPWYGGGIAVTNSSPTIRNVVFRSNRADRDGGGLFLSGSSSIIDSCVFHDNVAGGSGGAIAVMNSTPQFGNCTMYRDSAGAGGGGVYVGAGGNPALERCIVAFAAGGGGIYGETTAAGAAVSCCDVFGNAGGDYGGSILDRTGSDGNFSLDPIFCDPESGGLGLHMLSPCLSGRHPAGADCGLIGALGAACDFQATLLQGYSTSVSRSAVTIIWTLAQTGENLTFSVLRAEAPDGEYRILPSSAVAGDLMTFTFRDEGFDPGTAYRYRVDVSDGEGGKVLFETSPIVTPALPLSLYPNFPNPFNPSTTISYYLPEDSPVTLSVYDVSGRRVVELVGKAEKRGRHSVTWNGRDETGALTASGIYFCRLRAGKATEIRKIVLVR